MSYTIRPKKHQLRQARQAVQNSLEACKAVQEINKELIIDLGSNSDPFTREELQGATGFTSSRNTIELEFNSDAEKWEEGLKLRTAEEYGHALFLEKFDGTIRFNWQDLLYEAYAIKFAETALPQIENPKTEKYSTEQLSRKWESLKEGLEDEVDADRFFMYGSEENSMIGFSLAYIIGTGLMEDHEIKEIPEMNRNDVIEAGDRIFK